jgi:hypothetical protein
MEEVQLGGGRVTPGVLRVGDHRRPTRATQLGLRAEGRETFSFLSGDVPADLDPGIADSVLTAAAGLIRRFHDATASTISAARSSCGSTLEPTGRNSTTGASRGVTADGETGVPHVRHHARPSFGHAPRGARSTAG